MPTVLAFVPRLLALGLFLVTLSPVTWSRPDARGHVVVGGAGGSSTGQGGEHRTRTLESADERRVLALQARAAGPRRPLTLDTSLGRLTYVRTIEVLATYYTPANGGKAPGASGYGITATGARATRGVVAVDPRVIPLYSWLYIPGYGVAQARDVGGAIIGDHIDVAFDDGDGAWWGRRYLTVYLLAR